HGKIVAASRRGRTAQAAPGPTGSLVFLRVVHAVTLHEVDTRKIVDAFPHGMRLLLHLVPAHVRHLEAFAEFAITLTEVCDATGKQAKAFDAVVFLAAFHQRLHAHANDEQWLATGGHFKDRLDKTARAQFLHAITDRTDAGKHDPVGS